MELVFVYNAKTDVISAVTDYAHKVLSPSTYKCDLCQLTYHNLGQRKAWKAFKKSSNAKMEFWYIRQFEQEFKFSADYPVIFERKNGKLEIVLDKDQLSAFKDVDELIGALKSYQQLNE